MVTGVAGLIGNVVWQHLNKSPDKYDVYGLARRFQPSVRLRSGMSPVPADKWRLADIAEFDAMRRALQGMDVVVHMAAEPRGDAPWESVLRNNVTGAYNMYEACRLNGVKRVVYASTVMVSWGYQYNEAYKPIAEGRYDDMPKGFQKVTKEMATRPTDLYPASKVWGEALGRVYADVYGLSVICLRIGSVNDPDKPSDRPWVRDVWCSQRDIAQIVEKCVSAPDSVHFDIFYGISNNKYGFVDIEHARKVIGYKPQDSADKL